MTLEYAVSAGTVRGTRESNEDAFFSDTDRGIFIIADGVASNTRAKDVGEVSVRILKEILFETFRADATAEDQIQCVRSAVVGASNVVYHRLNATFPEEEHAHATLGVIVLSKYGLITGNVGDVRAYGISLRPRVPAHRRRKIGGTVQLNQLSVDHLVYDTAIKQNRPAQCIGQEWVSPNVVLHPFGQYDCGFLLCSDGLSSVDYNNDLALSKALGYVTMYKKKTRRGRTPARFVYQNTPADVSTLLSYVFANNDDNTTWIYGQYTRRQIHL